MGECFQQVEPRGLVLSINVSMVSVVEAVLCRKRLMASLSYCCYRSSCLSGSAGGVRVCAMVSDP